MQRTQKEPPPFSCSASLCGFSRRSSQTSLNLSLSFFSFSREVALYVAVFFSPADRTRPRLSFTPRALCVFSAELPPLDQLSLPLSLVLLINDAKMLFFEAPAAGVRTWEIFIAMMGCQLGFAFVCCALGNTSAGVLSVVSVSSALAAAVSKRFQALLLNLLFQVGFLHRSFWRREEREIHGSCPGEVHPVG